MEISKDGILLFDAAFGEGFFRAARGSASEDGPSGILYAEDFDAGPAQAAPEPLAPEPAPLTEADLAKARAEGFAAGQEQAQQEAESSYRARQNASLRALTDVLERSAAEISSAGTALAEETARCVLALAHALLGELADGAAPTQAAALLAHILPPLMHVPHLRMVAHPFMIESLGDVIEQVKGSYRGQMSLVADERVGQSDVTIEWPGGRAQWLDSKFRQELAALLRPLLPAGGFDPALLKDRLHGE